jgi:hypothetical protein
MIGEYAIQKSTNNSAWDPTLFWHFLVQPSNNAHYVNARIIRSIFIIIFVNLIGYFVIGLFSAFIYAQIESGLIIWIIGNSFQIVLNITASSTAPILYFTR